MNKLNNDPNVNGILVQLPLPNHINENKILQSINIFVCTDNFFL
ncbi:MAG: tetrahydrofolate dehydrogenase/cyclohydrolase catalytic domain-containing protein [Nitrososphaeraceae archaeon]